MFRGIFLRRAAVYRKGGTIIPESCAAGRDHLSTHVNTALAALHLLHQFRQLGAEAGGLGFVIMHDGVFKQRA